VPTILDKRVVLDLLASEFGALTSLCCTLSHPQWESATCLPGWTVHDVLSHVVGTEAMLAGQPSPDVDISRLEHVKNPIGEVNERWVEWARSLSHEELLSWAEEIIRGRLEQLEAMSQADFNAPSWTPVGRDETLGRLMRIRHYDCYMHEYDIRDAVGAPARQDTDDLWSATDEVASSLGYLVARKAAMPDGSRVRIDLTGPSARTFLVAVDGRAALVDSFDRPPTVGISLPASRFLRLTGGRNDRSPDPGPPVEYTGDVALGERLVANLAVTI
jgi:uncharacterized protein (TIGR03083 family)